MLTGVFPSSQTSIITSEICRWGQSVITNYAFLCGSNLMTHWQGVYARTLVLADATNVANGTVFQVPGLTSPGVLNSGGVVFADGGTMADDRLIVQGVMFADGVTYASGVVFADGRIAADAWNWPDLFVKAKVVVPGD